MEDREADEEGLDGRYEGTFLSCRLSQTFGRRAGSRCLVSVSAVTSHIPKSSADRKPRQVTRGIKKKPGRVLISIQVYLSVYLSIY